MNLTGYVQCILCVDSLVDIFSASVWDVFRAFVFWLLYWLYCFFGLSVCLSLHIVVWIKIIIYCLWQLTTVFGWALWLTSTRTTITLWCGLPRRWISGRLNSRRPLTKPRYSTISHTHFTWSVSRPGFFWNWGRGEKGNFPCLWTDELASHWSMGHGEYTGR